MKKILNDFLDNKIILNKKEKIILFLLLVVVSGVFGWLYEFIFYFFNDGHFSFQGGNFLPFINIYAYGSLLILFVTKKIKKSPLLVFITSIILTGILEYLSGYFILKLLNQRYWDYNIEILNFGNLGGFVCLRSVLIFGLCGLFLIYFVIPFIIYIIKNTNINKLFIISIILFSIFIIDELYNLIIPNISSLPSSSQIYKNIGIK